MHNNVITIAIADTNIIKLHDSISYEDIAEDSWKRREEKSRLFINRMNSYYNDSSKSSWKVVPDSILCTEIIQYYSVKNPLDGYPGEMQAITIYDLFYKNDSLFKAIGQYMRKMDIDSMAQDSIWMRISFDIMSNIWMNEIWDEEEQKTNFSYLLKNGYFINDYDSYIK